MAHDPAMFVTLRMRFIDAAAQYAGAGYELFINATARSEESGIALGRDDEPARPDPLRQDRQGCRSLRPRGAPPVDRAPAAGRAGR